MKNLSSDLPIVEKKEGLFTHEEIVYLGERLIDFNVVGQVKEGEEYVKVYERLNKE